MSKNTSPPEPEICPVDPATRAAWLKSNSGQKIPPPFPIPNSSSSSKSPLSSATCDSNTIDQSLPPSQSTPNPNPSSKQKPSFFSRLNPWSSSSPSQAPSAPQNTTLSTSREISSIPRTSTDSPKESGTTAANNEIESGPSATGKWIYPSEKMFYEAMKRKGYESDERDMRTIVPIHNAVNERAWKEIREWERPFCGSCPTGPQLTQFLGLGASTSTQSPRARFNSLLGYTAPFDRHDWVIDRCGKRVDYIIDFYAGKAPEGGSKAPGGMLSFYLDVRPKLNTWEGVRMRVLRGVGLA